MTETGTVIMEDLEATRQTQLDQARREGRIEGLREALETLKRFDEIFEGPHRFDATIEQTGLGIIKKIQKLEAGNG